MALEIDVADALVDVLNAGGFFLPLNASRAWAPQFRLGEGDLDVLTTSVVPAQHREAPISRGKYREDVIIHVCIEQKVDDIGPDTVDPLVRLVDEVAEALRSRRLGTVPATMVISTKRAPICEYSHLVEQGVFTSLLRVRVRTVE